MRYKVFGFLAVVCLLVAVLAVFHAIIERTISGADFAILVVSIIGFNAFVEALGRSGGRTTREAEEDERSDAMKLSMLMLDDIAKEVAANKRKTSKTSQVIYYLLKDEDGRAEGSNLRRCSECDCRNFICIEQFGTATTMECCNCGKLIHLRDGGCSARRAPSK